MNRRANSFFVLTMVFVAIIIIYLVMISNGSSSSNDTNIPPGFGVIVQDADSYGFDDQSALDAELAVDDDYSTFAYTRTSSQFLSVTESYEPEDYWSDRQPYLFFKGEIGTQQGAGSRKGRISISCIDHTSNDNRREIARFEAVGMIEEEVVVPLGCYAPGEPITTIVELRHLTGGNFQVAYYDSELRWKR